MKKPSTTTRIDRRRIAAFGLVIALAAAVVMLLAIDFGAGGRARNDSGGGPSDLEAECAALIERLAVSASTEFRGPPRERIDVEIVCSLFREGVRGTVDSGPGPVRRQQRLHRRPDGGVHLMLGTAADDRSFAASKLGDRYGRIREALEETERPHEDLLYARGFVTLPRGEAGGDGAVAAAAWGRTADRTGDPLRKFDVAVGPLVGRPLGGLFRLRTASSDDTVDFRLLHHRKHVLVGPDWRGSIEIFMNGAFVAPNDLPMALAGEVRVRERFHLERSIVDRDGERKVVADADESYRIVQTVSETQR